MYNYSIKKKKNVIGILSVITSFIMLATISSLPLLAAFASSADVGFQDGVSDCQSRSSNAINGHSNAGHHSAAYMDAYNRGLASCNNSDSNSQPNNGPSTSQAKCSGLGLGIVGGLLGVATGGIQGASTGFGLGNQIGNSLCHNQ